MKKLSALLLMLSMLAPASAHAQQGAFASAVVPNASSTGTTLNLLAKINTSGNAVLIATTDTNIPVYPVNSGAGTTGSASMQLAGPVLCVMDATTSNTGGFYVIASTTTAGRCHAQAARPTGGVFVIGTMISSATTSGSTATVAINPFAVTNTIRGIPFTIGDPGGSTLTVASTTTDYITVPFACTITAYNLAIDAGTITVKFWRKATGTAIPTSSDSISTSGVGISSGTAIHSATVSDFTSTAIAANDILAMNVTAVATAKYVTGTLQCDQ